MKQEHVKFTTPDWAGWKVVDAPEANKNKIKYQFVVDDNVINEVMEYNGVVATVREPFMESIMNIFIRLISGIVPNSDLKCAYILDFGNADKVNIFMANDVWSSHALISLNEADKLDLLVEASREYIRYRCFVDTIQPQQQGPTNQTET
jgi:hypothetical protein